MSDLFDKITQEFHTYMGGSVEHGVFSTAPLNFMNANAEGISGEGISNGGAGGSSGGGMSGAELMAMNARNSGMNR